MDSGQKIAVVYRKFDGSLHWHEQRRLLGEDEYGLWLGAGPNTPAQRGHEPEVVFPDPSVMLIPAGADVWWTAVFNAAPAKIATYCDITTPAEVRAAVDGSPAEVTMIDLDLDVVVVRDGREPPRYIDDEDEFAEHQVRYGYPDDVITAAERAAAELLPRVHGPGVDEPFRSAFRPWLAQAGGLDPVRVEG